MSPRPTKDFEEGNRPERADWSEEHGSSSGEASMPEEADLSSADEDEDEAGDDAVDDED